MDDLTILSSRKSEFHLVKGWLAEKGGGILRKSKRFQWQANPGRIHLVVCVHVLKSLNCINARGDCMQRDDGFAWKGGDIGGRNGLGIVVRIARLVIDPQPEYATVRGDVLDA